MGPPEKETPHPSELGGRKGKRGDTADLAARVRRYGTAKSHTCKFVGAIGAATAQEIGIRFQRVVECGDWLKFRDYYTGPGVKLHSANFCKNTLVCSLCAIRRASRNLAAYLDRLKVVQAERPALVAHLVTLTVRNRTDLGEALAHLQDSLRTLHRRRSRANQPSIMHSIAGGVFSIEVTNNGNGWHPHVHAIWLAEEAPNTYALRSEWEAITGDSFMCDVRPIELLTDCGPDIDPHAAGFAEVFKYAMKPSELGPERMVEAYPILKGRRLLGSFGVFRGVEQPRELADDCSGLEDLPYIELLLRYSTNGGYRREKTESCGPERTHRANDQLRDGADGSQGGFRGAPSRSVVVVREDGSALRARAASPASARGALSDVGTSS